MPEETDKAVSQLRNGLSDAFDRYLESVPDKRQVTCDDEGWRLKIDLRALEQVVEGGTFFHQQLAKIVANSGGGSVSRAPNFRNPVSLPAHFRPAMPSGLPDGTCQPEQGPADPARTPDGTQ